MPTNNVGAKSHKGASPNPRAPVPRHLLPARAPALVGDLTGRPPDDAMDSTAHGIWPRRAGGNWTRHRAIRGCFRRQAQAQATEIDVDGCAITGPAPLTHHHLRFTPSAITLPVGAAGAGLRERTPRRHVPAPGLPCFKPPGPALHTVRPHLAQAATDVVGPAAAVQAGRVCDRRIASCLARDPLCRRLKRSRPHLLAVRQSGSALDGDDRLELHSRCPMPGPLWRARRGLCCPTTR